MLEQITTAIEVGTVVRLSKTDPEFERKKATVKAAGYRFFGKTCTWYPKTMDLGPFYDLLGRHDWYYGYSDDPREYHRGEANNTLLKEIAKQSPKHQALFDGFVSHFFSGHPWTVEKEPLPARP